MTAIARLHFVSAQLATDEQDDAYIEAVREYRSKTAIRAREDWLLHEINAGVRRTNVIRARMTFAIEERRSMGFLKRQLAVENARIESLRAELDEIRGAA